MFDQSGSRHLLSSWIRSFYYIPPLTYSGCDRCSRCFWHWLDFDSVWYGVKARGQWQCCWDSTSVLTWALNSRFSTGKCRSSYRYHVLFGQYFRFDVSAQQPFFYREVPQFLQGLCVSLASEYLQDQGDRMCLMPFDPVLIIQGSRNRLVDSLMDVCLLLTRSKVIGENMGTVVLQQYKKSASTFGTVGWALIRLMSLSLMIYLPCDFLNLGCSAICCDEMRSRLNFVRSWMTAGFSGRPKKLLVGLIRHCASTVLQVSRLHDSERCPRGINFWREG